MFSKQLVKFNAAQAEAVADQAGMLAWVSAMLVIGLSLAMQLCGVHACEPMVALAAVCLYPLGLLLIVAGLLHLLATAITRRRGPARPRARYASAAWLPLWYRAHPMPFARPSLRFDHGQAWAWGTQCLLAVGIIQAAANLSADRSIVGNLALLAMLIPLHVLLADSRARIAAHGHS